MVDPEKGVDRNGDSILIQMRPNWCSRSLLIRLTTYVPTNPFYPVNDIANLYKAVALILNDLEHNNELIDIEKTD
jgi:hypothetical protein